ncbi:MAG: HAMP domain-containing histidine kinase [Melioribacteraceae bacterium]|nr:HAMP domain-containing histidine kinase [Melioribacteraceae bacterium]
MKRVPICLLALLIFTLNLQAQIPTIKISSIKVSDKNVFISKSEKLIIMDDDNLYLEFRANETDEKYNYQITLNNQPINNYNNSVEIKNLRAGNYVLSINGQSSLGTDILPASLSFVVKKAKESSLNSSNFNSLGIALLVIVLIQLVIIIILFSKKKKSLSVENKNEPDEIRTAYNTLKDGYKKLENKNRQLSFKVEDLKKNIQLLEDANYTLITQKEKLSLQKLKLEELQEQKDKVFAIAVHDIKNPASAIKGLLELLTSYDLNATEQQEIMESLITSSENILKLTQSIALTIAQEEPNNLIKKEKGSLKEIIDSVVAVNSAGASKKGIKLLNKSSSSIPNIKMDTHKIEEAIDNLVNNAVKYSPLNTEVVIKSYFSTTEVSVEVTDDGVGLSKEDQEKAFKKGVTLTPKPTGGETSSGLGLWIVKTIIEGHGGKVWIKSKLGVGSNFGFSIPIK